MILVVDDEPAWRDRLAELLRELGYSVTTAANGEDAVARARTQSFVAIFLDLGLPGMSGMAALRELRKVTAAPVIVVTAFPDAVIRDAAMRRGATAVLAKEDVADALPELVKRLISP